jgi:membrane protease YdiL (CAAX protease family)
LDKIPAKGNVLIWVVIYYFFVALIEELFNRGVLLNTLLKGFERYKQGVIIGIFLSSIIFALGHIPGMLQYTLGAMVGKVVLAFGLGIFFGCIYVCTNKNILTVIILHWLFDMSSAIFISYSSSGDMFANVFERVVVSLILAVIGLICIAKRFRYIEYKNYIKMS